VAAGFHAGLRQPRTSPGLTTIDRLPPAARRLACLRLFVEHVRRARRVVPADRHVGRPDRCRA
jgi:hypothetical protein